jgi:hypothetical protein
MHPPQGLPLSPVTYPLSCDTVSLNAVDMLTYILNA